MKVSSMMNPRPITITEDSSIEDAIRLMKSNAIRHLPVVSENDTLQGFVTLADLKEGLLPSMVSGVSMKDLIIKNPLSVSQDDDIETVAILIYKHKISGLPVVNGNRLVGIITENDILRTFIDMMGLLTTSSRIEAVIDDDPAAIKKVIHIIHNNGGDIINVSMTAHEASQRIYYFRLFPCKTDIIKKALESENIAVLNALD